MHSLHRKRFVNLLQVVLTLLMMACLSGSCQHSVLQTGSNCCRLLHHQAGLLEACQLMPWSGHPLRQESCSHHVELAQNHRANRKTVGKLVKVRHQITAESAVNHNRSLQVMCFQHVFLESFKQRLTTSARVQVACSTVGAKVFQQKWLQYITDLLCAHDA